MDLATAGVISGAGEGVSKAADAALSGGIQSALLDKREAADNLRLEKTQQFSREQAQETEANAVAREDRTNKTNQGLLQQKQGGDILLHNLRETGENTRAKAAQDSSERIHTEATTAHTMSEDKKNKLLEKELEMKKTYYEALIGMKNGAAGAKGGAAANQLPKEYLESVTKPLIDNLHKQMELATPDERDNIQERIDHIVDEARRVAGLSIPSVAIPTIKDRFAKPTGAAGGQ